MLEAHVGPIADAPRAALAQLLGRFSAKQPMAAVYGSNMTFCSRPNCAEPITEDTLRLCAAHADTYRQRQAQQATLVERLIAAKPQMFARLTATAARRLAAHIIGHAAAGRTGFDNEILSRAEIVAANDAIAESRQDAIERGWVPVRRPVPPHECQREDKQEDTVL